MNDKVELRQYLFATDTTHTSNAKLPWKNKTTRPKLTQIRDNLHANYLSALFPNEDWMRWEGFSEDAETLEKKRVITGYMQNKLRMSDFRNIVSQLLYDYIDYGNAFADVDMVVENKEDPETGERIPQFIGPKAKRISPLDIVFNPLAASFEQSPKIVRYIKTIGELKKELEHYPENQHFSEAIARSEEVRRRAHAYSKADWAKAQGYLVDGFGSLQAYYTSNYVEIIEFEGDIHDSDTGEFLENQVITVIDRAHILRKETKTRWISGSAKVHCGWRKRPDTLWAMGPLDNLVGMQYRIDHLENIAADAMDLAVQPPVVVSGDVEDFDWHPGAVIYAGEGGLVTELGKNLNGVMVAKQDIALLEDKMEELAGAPREAMGIRTPGEKTAFEVEQLMTAAGRIFQEKITQFEIDILEPLLNSMLETARRNLDSSDIIRVLDEELEIPVFLTITKEDITSEGKLRPVGARHFSAQSQLIQNLTGIFNSPIGGMIQKDVSPKALAKLVEEVLGLERYALFSDNAMLIEQAEAQKMQHDLEEDVADNAMTPGLRG